MQGRGDVQSANARTGMLDDIQTHISDRTPMSLNFIYGQIEEVMIVTLSCSFRSMVSSA